MHARTPEGIDTLFADALNAGKLDALVDLYEPDAALMPSPGNVVSGASALRDRLPVRRRCSELTLAPD